MKILNTNLGSWKNQTIFLCKHTPIPLVRVQGYARVWTSKPLPLPLIPLPLSCLNQHHSRVATHRSLPSNTFPPSSHPSGIINLFPLPCHTFITMSFTVSRHPNHSILRPIIMSVCCHGLPTPCQHSSTLLSPIIKLSSHTCHSWHFTAIVSLFGPVIYGLLWSLEGCWVWQPTLDLGFLRHRIKLSSLRGSRNQ
jgi:hypothetical protein